MEGVQVVNPEGLKRKLGKFKKDNFHIISDFDRTLTKAFVDGKKMLSTYAFVREGGYLSSDYVKRAFELADYYRPIEFDSKIPQKEKEERMAEWWSKHYDLMIKSGMSLEVVKEIVKKNRIKLREGTEVFFKLLDKNNIPILVFSSGLGNLIKEFLMSKKFLTPNLHLISNFLIFDKEGKAVSYVRPLIHTFNKNEVQIKNYPYQKGIEKRKKVILLGDVLGDLGMTEGVKHDEIIKVGFLNENKEILMDDYKKNFDVVILNDGPMDYVNELLKKLLK